MEEIQKLITLGILPSYMINIAKAQPLLLSDALHVQKTSYTLYGDNDPHIITQLEELIKKTKNNANKRQISCSSTED